MFLVLFLDAEDRECSKLLNICFSWKFITPEIGVKISCYTFSDHDELLLWNGWPMSEIITIPNLLTNIRDSYHPRSPTHYKEYLNQFRLYWMKCAIVITTTPRCYNLKAIKLAFCHFYFRKTFWTCKKHLAMIIGVSSCILSKYLWHNDSI